jgi:hypothetical protein
MSLLERYKGQWAYLLSMALAVFAFSFICYCELTGGIVYPNPRMSLMWAVALPSLMAALVQFRDHRLFRERCKRDEESRQRAWEMMRRLERNST